MAAPINVVIVVGRNGMSPFRAVAQRAARLMAEAPRRIAQNLQWIDEHSRVTMPRLPVYLILRNLETEQ